MITTIKLPYKSNNSNYINELLRQCSIVYRYSFNRFQEGFNEKQIREKIKNLNNINDLDSWFIQSSIKEAEFLYKSTGDEKIIFSKENFIKRLKNKISKDEYKQNKIFYVSSIGEKLKSGNRKFKLQVIENNMIVFKPNRKTKIEFQLPKLRKNYKNQLSMIQNLMEQKQIPVSFKLDNSYIYISFDIYKNQKIIKKSEGNHIGIDLNPNFISCSLFNKNKCLLKSWTFNLSNLTKKSGKSSFSNESKYLQNKLNFELFEISKKINNLCVKNNVDFVFIEELKIKSSNKNKGKNFNRLCNNIWKRNKFISNLEKRCELNNIKLFKINPTYSSFIGNIRNNLPDPISASCEIARRGYDVIILKNKKFYPDLINVENLKRQWKDVSNWIYSNWKELYSLFKNSKLKYRVSWSSDYVFRDFITNKSKIKYNYYNFDLKAI